MKEKICILNNVFQRYSNPKFFLGIMDLLVDLHKNIKQLLNKTKEIIKFRLDFKSIFPSKSMGQLPFKIVVTH